MRYAYVDAETRAITISTIEPPGVSMWWPVPDDTDPNALVIGTDGEIVHAPAPAAAPWLLWDPVAEAWRDTRAPDEIAEERERERAFATMSRTAFCVACARAGIISEDEAIAAAGGAVPAAFQPLLDEMTPEDRFEARVRWAGAQSISRVDPIILSCAAAIGMSPEALDALFGITPAP